MLNEERPRQNRNKFVKTFLCDLQTTEILLMASILSICKTMAYYIGICISNTKFLEIKQRALKQEYGVFMFVLFKYTKVLNQESRKSPQGGENN